MERYKLFVEELKEENKRILKKTIYVNNRTKYAIVLHGKQKWYNYFIESYEQVQKNNVHKYYKHKIETSKRKKTYLNTTFPFFEIYKNTNEAFKNNLHGYHIFKIIKSYDELHLFEYCAKNNLNHYTYLFNHFIEIINKKRDLYNIQSVLLLLESIKKLNYYNPYFCKLISREVVSDLHKIKKLKDVTGFISFLLHFNIFNFYYLDKVYKYIIYLICKTNQWNFKKKQQGKEETLIEKLVSIEDRREEQKEQNNGFLEIGTKDIKILINSFKKYAYFDITLLKLIMYICTHEQYDNLKNVQTFYDLSTIGDYFYFVNKEYSVEFLSLCTEILDRVNKNEASPFLPLLKGFYNVSKIWDVFNEKEYRNILQLFPTFQEKKQIKDLSKKENQSSEETLFFDIQCILYSNANKNPKRKTEKRKIILQPFNSHIDTNLKKMNLSLPYLKNRINKKEKDCLFNWCDIIIYIILCIEMKILQKIPWENKKNNVQIEFLKRKNFERDHRRNVYKYLASNMSQEQSKELEYIWNKNKTNAIFDDSNHKFLFYLNYYNHTSDTFLNTWEEMDPSEEENIEKEKQKITSEDINRYLKNKETITFTLKDKTYYSHIFNNLITISLENIEEEILKNGFKQILLFSQYVNNLDVNKIANLFYSLTIFQIIQGYRNGKILKNQYGFYKKFSEESSDYEPLYKLLSNLLIKQIINIQEENLYKVILSCSNSAYSDVYLNHFIKNFNRYIKFSKMRKHMNC